MLTDHVFIERLLIREISLTIPAGEDASFNRRNLDGDPVVFVHVIDPAYPLPEPFVTELTVVLVDPTMGHLVVSEGLLGVRAPETVATVILVPAPAGLLFRLQVDGNTTNHTVRLSPSDEVKFVLVDTQLSAGSSLVRTLGALEHGDPWGGRLVVISPGPGPVISSLPLA